MDRKKKSHYNCRVSLHEAPTKKWYSQVDCFHEQSNAATASLQLWHEKLVGHNTEVDVRILAKTVVNMKLVDEGDELCDVYNTKKVRWLPIRCQVATRAEKTL